MKAAEKKLTRMKDAASRARRRAGERKKNLIRKASAYGAGYGIGKLESTGRMESIPTIFGVPRTVTLGLAASAAAFALPESSMIGHVADGVGDGCLTVAAYQFAKGQTVSGAEDEELARLDQALAALEPGVSGYDEDVGYDDDDAEAMLMEAAED